MRKPSASSHTSSQSDSDHLISRSPSLDRREKNKKVSRSHSYVVPETPPPTRSFKDMGDNKVGRVWDWQTENEFKHAPSPSHPPARGVDRIAFARQAKTISSIEHVPAAQRPPRSSTSALSQSDSFSEYLPTPASSVGSRKSKSSQVPPKGVRTNLIDGSTSQDIQSVHTATTGSKITELPKHLLGRRRNRRDLRLFKQELNKQVVNLQCEAAGLFNEDGWCMSRDRLEATYHEISNTLEVYKDLLRNDLLHSENKTYKLVKDIWSACNDRLAKLRSSNRDSYASAKSTRGSEMMEGNTNWVERVNEITYNREPNTCQVGQSSQHMFQF